MILALYTLSMLINICMQFHEDILNGFQVTERKRCCDGLVMDRQTDDPCKNNVFQP